VSRDEHKKQYGATAAALTAATLFAFGFGFMNDGSREAILIPSLACLAIFGLLAQWSLMGEPFALLMLLLGIISLPYTHIEITNVGLRIGFLSCGVSFALLAGIAHVDETPPKIAAVHMLLFLFYVGGALLFAPWWLFLILAISLAFVWWEADGLEEKAGDRKD